MTAEQMFKELGYTFYKSSFKNAFFYEFKNEKTTKNIVFDLDDKKYYIAEYTYFEKTAFGIDYKLHQAITKQMEELGWL